MCYGPGPAHTGNQSIPQFGNGIAYGRERAETGNNNSFQLHKAKEWLSN